MEKIIVVAGITASGKSRLAVELARLFNGEIISADAYQVYRGMSVGTNKLSAAAMQGVRHHLIDCVDVDEPWDVSLFQSEGRKIISRIVSEKKVPIVCGGTGFYINALLKDYCFLPVVAKNDYSSMTNEQLHAELASNDSAEAAKIPANNRRRVEKALDFVRGHKIKKSVHDQGTDTYLYDPLILFLDPPKEVIAPLIASRTAAMLANGWYEEVRDLASKYPDFAKTTAIKAIGYEDVLLGKADADQIARQILKYSRKQRTWFVNKKKEPVVVLKEVYSPALLQKCQGLVAAFLGVGPCV